MSTDSSRTPRLKVDRETARAKLEAQIRQGRQIANTRISSSEELSHAQAKKSKWSARNSMLLKTLFGTEEVANDFHATFGGVSVPRDFSDFVRSFGKQVEWEVTRLEGVKEQLDLYEGPEAVEATDDTDNDWTALDAIEQLCTRFHLVARQLTERHAKRDTLAIADEYDVQDLFHALLHIDFDDIRPEEYTPSYAGKATRMDFLLPEEKLVVEVKKTRGGLGAGEVGTQLIEDIARYKTHPDCSTLICFVYDPDGHIKNPRGFERDLNSADDGLVVRVLVTPKGY